jgi:hypothetical protein
MVHDSDRGGKTTTRATTDISTGITRTDATPPPASNVKRTARVASGLNVLAGLWLILAPWVIGHGAVWNATIVGLLVVILAGIRCAKPLKAPALSWIVALLGVWMMVVPFIIPHGSGTAADPNGSFWHDIILGAVITILALLSADSTNNEVTS